MHSHPLDNGKRGKGIMQANILLIDDDAGLCDLLANDLEARGHRARRAHSAEDGLRLLGEDNFDVVVTDVNMGGMSGVDLCRHVRARHEDLPVVVMTAYGTLESAISAIRAGAYDFITKPFEFDHFSLVIDRALGLHALRREVARLKSGAQEESAVIAPDLQGRSPALERVRDLIARVADTESTILVTGESGTGKELVAKAIHDASGRKAGQFVAINCAAMPETLLESELFGHARGAFTDAKAPRTGLFVRANQGTVFLDEIGEMPAGMQAKLLRALQERRVRPVGSDTEVEFDARIITATHRDLETEVNEKKFREDLFYRINVVRIHVPPLRARGNDTLILAQRFLEKLAVSSKREVKGMSAAVAQKLLAYPWPGNVRQLQNCIERAVAVARGKEIALEDLPDDVRDYQPSKVDLVGVDTNDAITAMPTMDEIERRYIRQVLGAVAGNKTLAAQILGFDRRTLYRKLDRMNEQHAAARPQSHMQTSASTTPASTITPPQGDHKSIPPATA
ncbi:MAG TPA: sigma-54 dependent transcriptional regulator [Polyangiaceae bacterium]